MDGQIHACNWKGYKIPFLHTRFQFVLHLVLAVDVCSLHNPFQHLYIPNA